ncbi:MAG: hypothetical protein WCG85_18240 [Polyangia bacterium]
MRSLGDLRRRLDRAATAAQPRPMRPHRRTTSENREALDGLLNRIDSLVAEGAPPHPDRTGLSEAQKELDRILVVMDSDGTEPRSAQ